MAYSLLTLLTSAAKAGLASPIAAEPTPSAARVSAGWPSSCSAGSTRAWGRGHHAWWLQGGCRVGRLGSQGGAPGVAGWGPRPGGCRLRFGSATRRERAERPEAPRRGRGDVPDEAHLALGVHLVEGEPLGLGLELGLGLGLGLGLSTW